ncbi:MAG: hypothetical protein U0269_19385 [Polyangiales bacterium]
MSDRSYFLQRIARWLPLVALCAGACRGPSATARNGRNGSAAGAGPTDAGPSMMVPQELAPVGGQSPSGREIDAPLAWLFLPQTPVTTGSVPDVLAASHLPCGFRAMYGTVQRDGNQLRVRVRARYTGPNVPTDRTTPCPTEPPSIQYVSLNTIRLGEYTVVDAAAHPAGTVPAPPPLALSVIPDDPSAPSASARWVRACTAGDDNSCAQRGRGACGAVRETPGRGVCVPPIDAFLAVNRPCPQDTTEFTLDHPGAYSMPVAPAPGALRACLPSCNAQGACPSGLQCVRREGGSAGACVPQ